MVKTFHRHGEEKRPSIATEKAKCRVTTKFERHTHGVRERRGAAEDVSEVAPERLEFWLSCSSCLDIQKV